MVSALGGKFGFWEPLDGFRHLLTYAGLPGFGGGFVMPMTLGLGIAALVIVVLARLVQGARYSAAPGGYVAGVLAIFVGATPMLMVHLGADSRAAIPPIHDITTDTQNPPQFTASLVERRGANSNSIDYASKIDPRSERPLPEVQAEAYPDVQPLVVNAEAVTVYRAALNHARDNGWAIGTASENELAFEATAETFWFGFKDDVVVKLSELETGETRVDMRSVSRVGVSDLGANAARVEEFLGYLSGEFAG
jgi:hypothetical protein